MDEMERFIRLDRFHRQLMSVKLDELQLKGLDPLRIEIAEERQKLLNQEKHKS